MRAVEMIARLGPRGGSWIDAATRGSGGPVIGRDELVDALLAVQEPLGRALLLMAALADDARHVELVRREAWRELDAEYERQERARAEEQRRRRTQIIAEASTRRGAHGKRGSAAGDRPRAWPEFERNADKYEKLVAAVIAELTKGPITCLTCRGERTVQGVGGEGRMLCPKCAGSGLHPSTPRERGQRLGVTRTACVVTWAPVFEFLIGYLADRMQQAALEFNRQIMANLRDVAA